MAKVRFVLPGAPRGKAVARVTQHGTFIPKSTREEMEALRLIARNAMRGAPPFSGPVHIRLCAYMPVPVSWPQRKRADALAGRLLPVSKPDGSNVQKLVEDAILPPHIPRAKLQRLTREQIDAARRGPGAVIIDDSQIVRWEGWKLYSDDPRVVVEVIEIDPSPERDT